MTRKLVILPQNCHSEETIVIFSEKKMVLPQFTQISTFCFCEMFGRVSKFVSSTLKLIFLKKTFILTSHYD